MEGSLCDLLPEPGGAVGGDAVNAGGAESAGFGRRIDSPDVKVETGGFDLLDEGGGDGTVGADVDAVKVRRQRFLDQVSGVGKPAATLPMAAPPYNPIAFEIGLRLLYERDRFNIKADGNDLAGAGGGDRL